MKTKLKTIALAIGLLTVLASTNTFAASLSSNAAIDLNLLTVLDTDGSLATIFPDYGNAFSDANAEANGSHFSNDPNFASLNISENGGTVGTSADPTLMLSQIAVTDLGWGNGTGEYLLDYTAAGTGQIEITVPYSISIDAQTAATTDPASNAWGLIRMEDLFGGVLHEEYLDWQAFGDVNGVKDNFGLLSIVLDVVDGDTGQLRFYAESGVNLFDSTVVPLPAPALLMLSGLLGITFTGRRGAKQAA